VPAELSPEGEAIRLSRLDRVSFARERKGVARKLGIDVPTLRALVAEKREAAEPDQPRKQADVLIALTEDAQLFHTADGVAFADIEVNEHRETWSIRANGFTRWLRRRFFEKLKSAPNSEAMQSALGVIEAKAHFDAPERKVYLRVGEFENKIYLDLCDTDWRAIEVDANGWRVVTAPPVRFRRTRGMLPLPVPVPGGTIKELRSFLNVKSDADFTLNVAWLFAALRPTGPYPVLAESGEQGTAKSTKCIVLRRLIDPNSAGLRALPREERDLFIAATNGYVLAFDNVSGLVPWVSDALCRLATSGGFAVRALYTDQDEVLFDATRPFITNGIEDFITRPDLADRSIILVSEAIPADQRRDEKEFWAAFELAQPRILGALLDGVAHGLKQLPTTQLKTLPRMADFALWATACETAFWPSGTFWAAYCGNLDTAIENVLEADLVATAVRSFMKERAKQWKGTSTALLDALNQCAAEATRKANEWPKAAHVLSGKLRRAAPGLRKVGIQVDIGDRDRRSRSITLSFIASDWVGGEASQASHFARGAGTITNISDLGGDANERSKASPARSEASPDERSVIRKPLKINGRDAGDACDASLPSQSDASKHKNLAASEGGLNGTRFPQPRSAPRARSRR
jgi:hypothetical protein